VNQRPLCVVSVELDAVYTDLLAPAIRDARLDPLRADREPHERLILVREQYGLALDRASQLDQAIDAYRRLEGGAPDYWDHAARLELGVVRRDQDEARAGATAALASAREPWEPEATAYNLTLIRESRRARDETIAWADEIERELRS
jgi:hypothetical protein